MCGSSKIAAGVKQTIIKVIADQKGLDEEKAVACFNEVLNGRYATDIFE